MSEVNVLPAGRYVLSDPCYVIGTKEHKDWCDLLNRHDYFTDGGIFEENNVKFAVFSTKWGDGEYSDQFGQKYFVDAGMLSCIPWEMVENKEGMGDYFHVMEFFTDFEVSEKDGIIYFGPVKIDTAYEETEEGYDEGEYDQ
jgi:hypothetical protein